MTKAEVRFVSLDEYEAVLRRLTRSARKYAEGLVSSSYTDVVLAALPG